MMQYDRNQQGLSLLETIVVIGIYTILLLAVNNSIFNLYQYNSYALEQGAEVDNARVGITEWNRDVKEMTTAEDGTWPIAVIEPHRLAYYSDTDLDELVEYVVYELATTTLYKHTHNATGSPPVYDLTTPDETRILSRYVQNILQGTSTFYYFDEMDTELSSTSPVIDVRFIQMQLIVNIDPVRNPGEFMLRSGLAPRNLKDNL